MSSLFHGYVPLNHAYFKENTRKIEPYPGFGGSVSIVSVSFLTVWSRDCLRNVHINVTLAGMEHLFNFHICFGF